MVISLKQAPSVQTALVSLLTLAALLLLVRELVALTWVLLAPAPAAPAVPVLHAMPDVQAARHLFGAHGESLAPSAAVVQASGLTLLGLVAAAAGQQGYAVLRLDDGTVLAVGSGQEVVPGLVLLEVATDRLVLERAGLRETLVWPAP